MVDDKLQVSRPQNTVDVVVGVPVFGRGGAEGASSPWGSSRGMGSAGKPSGIDGTTSRGGPNGTRQPFSVKPRKNDCVCCPSFDHEGSHGRREPCTTVARIGITSKHHTHVRV